MEVLRIVLLGKCRVGKSSSGNTLLGSKAFHTAPSPRRVTQACSMSISTVDGHKLHVVDTPGWIDISLTEDETTMEIIKSIDISDPGPHVLLLVLPIGQFTKEETDVAKQILKVFGEEAIKYMMVLFTKGDDLEEKTIEEYLTDDHPDLKKVIEICEGRYHVFNNGDEENLTQVSTLLEKIKAMVEKNEGKHYTNAMFQKKAGQMEEIQKFQMLEEECKLQMSDSNEKSNNGATIRGSVEGKQCAGMEGGDKYVVHIAKSHCEKSRSEKQRGEKTHGEKSLHQGPGLENNSKDLHKMEVKWQKTEAELQRSIERVEMMWLKEKGGLEKEMQQLQMKLREQKIELEKVKKELQQQKVRGDTFEKLSQEGQRQREELERLKREIDEERQKMRRRSTALQKTLDEFERVMDMKKETDLKTTLRLFLSQLKKNVLYPK